MQLNQASAQQSFILQPEPTVQSHITNDQQTKPPPEPQLIQGLNKRMTFLSPAETKSPDFIQLFPVQLPPHHNTM